jgi:hypothetical protein
MLTCATCQHCNPCHYCNVDFVLFYNVTCYTNSTLSRINVSTTKLLDIMCILVATSVILHYLECTPIWHQGTLIRPQFDEYGEPTASYR